MNKLALSKFHLLAAVLVAVSNRPSTASEDGLAPVVEAPAEMVPFETTVEPRAIPRSLGAKEKFVVGINIHDLGPVPEEEIVAADARAIQEFGAINPGPQRIGLVRAIPLSPLSVESGDLMQTDRGGGEAIWTMSVRSPGAYGVRLHFSNVDLADGELIVYADEGVTEPVVRGAYSGFGPDGSGDFWTETLPGEEVRVEYVGEMAPRFEIAEFVHLDRNPNLTDDTPLAAEQGGPLSCHEDVMCHTVNSFARNATGQMNFVKNGGNFVCTGTMINDQDPDTTVPHFITAYHCLATQSVVNSLEVVWLYQKSFCNGLLPNYFTLPRSTGGTLLATNPTSGGNDMTFIRLNGSVPGGVTLAGWTTAIPGSAYGIHHPAGSWKRYVHFQSSGLCPGCEFCGDSSDYEFYNADVGLIEPGSSGSGIFNSSGQLFGQLFGHCCVTLDCAGETLNCGNIDEFNYYYGEFETTHPLISYWMQVGGTFNVNIAFPFNGNGTPSLPFKTILAAHAAAWDGLRFKIQAGTYPGAHTITKQVTLVANGGTAVIGG